MLSEGKLNQNQNKKVSTNQEEGGIDVEFIVHRGGL